MKTVYTIELSWPALVRHGDMLRYDGAFAAISVGEPRKGGTVRVECLCYTPARWSSFGGDYTLVGTRQVTSRDYTLLGHHARGFIVAIRLAYIAARAVGAGGDGFIAVEGDL
jgi:hypothetical protein